MAQPLDSDEGSLLIRTYFSDDDAWDAVVANATKPYGPDGLMAYFVPVDDRAFEGMQAEEFSTLDGDALDLRTIQTPSSAAGSRPLMPSFMCVSTGRVRIR